jgi:uncharacterized oligopeptide transporter (OPT) family protein
MSELQTTSASPRKVDAVAPTQPVREFTLRALLAGCVLGALFATTNVYAGFKTAYADGGSIASAVLAFAAFSALGRLGKQYSPLENHLSQAVASAAAFSGDVAGLLGPVPALALLGFHYPSWIWLPWGLGLSVLGLGLAVLLRERLIVVDALPFPTGAATAEVILGMAEGARSAVRRAKFLAGAALASAALTWFRDGPVALVPGDLLLPGTLAGLSLASLSVGVSVSPLLFSAGALIGVREAASMLLGSLIAWLWAVPQLVSAKVLSAEQLNDAYAWLMWPCAALVLSGSLVSLLGDLPSMRRGLRALPGLWRRGGAQEQPGTKSRARWAVGLLLGASVLSVLGIAHWAFGVAPQLCLLGLVLAVLGAVACARAAGETDSAPSGMMGGATQMLLGGAGSVTALVTGSIASGIASRTAGALWTFKAGHRLGASLKSQLLGQLLGAGLGTLLAIPVYLVLTRTYGMANERLPAPVALSWKATAEAVGGRGLESMQAFAGEAALIGVCFGVLGSLLEKRAWARFTPSATAVGIGLLFPPSQGSVTLLGAMTALMLLRRYPQRAAELLPSVAAGGLAGESLMAVVIAALTLLGVLGGG